MFKKKTLIFICIFSILVCLLSIPVSATSVDLGVFTMPISQPPVGQNYGYIEVLSQGHTPYVFLYTMNTAVGSDPLLLVDAKYNYIKLRASANEGSSGIWVYRVDGNGDCKYFGNGLDSWITLSFPNGIAGVHIYGNTSFIQDTSFDTQPQWSIAYGVDGESYSLLNKIYTALITQSNADIIANADKNANNIQSNADKNASQIQQNQDENTDKQIQSDKDLYNQEHQEIEDSGNQATDAADNIPDKSEGFISSLTNFVSAMSTTDTSCSITFPAITTPAIAGIPSYTLSAEQEVDFSEAISLLPTSIMTLVQSLLTIALIIFAFKELYDTISEALTRRKMSDE